MKRRVMLLLLMAALLSGCGTAPGQHAAPARTQAPPSTAAPATTARLSVAAFAAPSPAPQSARWIITTRHSHATLALAAIVFSDRAHGWIVGAQDTILATSDGGASWYFQNAGGSGNGTLNAVAAPHASAGWAIGDTVFSTGDGRSWSERTDVANGSLNALAFPTANDGWAVGDAGSIVSTNDGGATWTAQSSGADQALTGVSFTDPNHGWAVGWRSPILATSDGGATWNALDGGTHYVLKAVAFSDAQHGWAVGYDGYIMRTTDGGATWTGQNSEVTGTSNTLRGVAFTDNLHGWVVGDGGILLQTVDGGATWNHAASGTSRDLYGLTFTDPAHGWAVGDKGVTLRLQRVIGPSDPVATVHGTIIRTDAFERFQTFMLSWLPLQQSDLQAQINTLRRERTHKKADATAISTLMGQQKRLHSDAANLPAYTLQQMEYALLQEQAASTIGATPTAARITAALATLARQAGGNAAYRRLLTRTGVRPDDLRTYYAAPLAIQINAIAHFAGTKKTTAGARQRGQQGYQRWLASLISSSKNKINPPNPYVQFPTGLRECDVCVFK